MEIEEEKYGWIYGANGEELSKFKPGGILQAEYGSSGRVGILPGTLKNSDEEEMNCACGNPGAMMIAGREAFQVLCHNCAVNFGHKHDLHMDLDKPITRANHGI